ncbi:MAG: histidine kinase [Phaeodactylibacter sp.]|nr:histidine kinase [Phaeodactylibacter sp.]
MQNILKRRWAYHTLIWISGFVFVESISWMVVSEGDFNQRVGESLAYTLPFIPIVYLNFYLKEKYYDKRKYGQYFLSIPIQVALGVAIYQLDYLVFSEAGQSALQDASNVFFLIAFTTGLQYFKRGVVNQYQLQELRAKNAEMELNSLKAQINPHFLFNNLNNIYSINEMDSSKGSEMLLELAEVMRYHLQFSKQDKISLSDEVQLIKSYIELEKLRLNENCELTIDIKDVDNRMLIAPLLFLPFIENAFKHGTHPTKPSFVTIRLKEAENKVVFEVLNSVINHKKVVKTNIGLQNTRKRLSLLYPEKHQLDIAQKEHSYHVNLQIELD